MKTTRLPQTDSIEELARFWDSHSLTDFEDELEEVTEPVFVRDSETVAVVHLPPEKLAAVQRIAKARGIDDGDLLREWVLEGLDHAVAGV